MSLPDWLIRILGGQDDVPRPRRERGDYCPVEWVQQQERNSCVVACLAMILGVDYGEARSRLPLFDPAVGLSHNDLLRVITEAGWAYQQRWRQYSPTGHERPYWPPAPWAPLHLCAVRTPDGGMHAVLMDHDGTVHDPISPEPCTLHSYPEIFEVVGLWQVGTYLL